MQFTCPIDGAALSSAGNTLRCPAGHSFDLAKEGYCNLLLVQQKASLDPGDNNEMVAARRRFLAGGSFAPIADRLIALMASLPASAARTVLDAGCGEGYYLGRLQAARPDADYAGVDISKWAVRAAAKSYRAISWAVASNKSLPVADHSVRALLCLFGFPFWKSFRKALAAEGHVLLVDPGPRHLQELRELVYETVNATDVAAIDGAYAEGFSLVCEETLSFGISVESNQALRDLLAMTPHGYRMNEAARERIARVEQLNTTVEVVFRILRAD